MLKCQKTKKIKKNKTKLQIYKVIGETETTEGIELPNQERIRILWLLNVWNDIKYPT